MNKIEQLLLTLRHSSLMCQADWLWDRIRPMYNRFITLISPNGLDRTINGTDNIRVLHRFRQMGEVYEPDVWQNLMEQVCPGDIIVDVGAYIGLYTIALAKRVGRSGKVVAFEPDPINYTILHSHIKLNGLMEQVQLRQEAVGDLDTKVNFLADGSSMARISQASSNLRQIVNSVKLDTVFSEKRIDILKIDVEGYEWEVLNGAKQLLNDSNRRPRLICIEVHPYAWANLGTSAKGLLDCLKNSGYRIIDIVHQSVQDIQAYREIFALRQ